MKQYCRTAYKFFADEDAEKAYQVLDELHGAKAVTGVDISEKMLTVAKEKTDSKIRYIQMPIEDIAFGENSFYAIISSLAFHYIESFEQIVEKVSGCLIPNADFVFSIEHPIFTAYGSQDWYYDENGNILHFPVDNYFFEGERTANFLGEKLIKYHKTLTTYLNGLIQGGFELTGIVEPQPPEYLLHTVKGMEDELRRPEEGMLMYVSLKLRTNGHLNYLTDKQEFEEGSFYE